MIAADMWFLVLPSPSMPTSYQLLPSLLAHAEPVHIPHNFPAVLTPSPLLLPTLVPLVLRESSGVELETCVPNDVRSSWSAVVLAQMFISASYVPAVSTLIICCLLCFRAWELWWSRYQAVGGVSGGVTALSLCFSGRNGKVPGRIVIIGQEGISGSTSLSRREIGISIVEREWLYYYCGLKECLPV